MLFNQFMINLHSKVTFATFDLHTSMNCNYIQCWHSLFEVSFKISKPVHFTIENEVQTKYSKHLPYTVAHTIGCVCSKTLNDDLNRGLLFSLFKFFG